MNAPKQVLGEIFSLLPPALWSRICGGPVVLPYYHVVSDDQLPHIRHLYSYRSIPEFREDVDFFCRHFTPIDVADLGQSLRNEKKLPERSVLLTFDDGFREMADIVAPILKAKGVPALFFINSAFTDNRAMCYTQKISLLVEVLQSRAGNDPLTGKISRLLREFGIAGQSASAMLRNVRYEQQEALETIAAACEIDFSSFLRERSPYLTSGQIKGVIRDGFAVGGHSVDHPRYGRISLESQLRQTRESMHFLQERFGIQEKAFAFPHSDSGVGSSFFWTIFSEGTVSISFGTGGLVKDTRPGHFQRFSMETTRGSARRIASWHHARRLGRQLLGGAFRGTAKEAVTGTSAQQQKLRRGQTDKVITVH